MMLSQYSSGPGTTRGPTSSSSAGLSTYSAGPDTTSDAAPLDTSPKRRATLQKISDDGTKHDLLSCLACAQERNIDMIGITWEEGRKKLGEGGQGVISQSDLSLDTLLAFKRTRPDVPEKKSKRIDRAFQELYAEISILGDRDFRSHPNINNLEGMCWEVRGEDSMWPVLIFPKAPHGDLFSFMGNEKEERGLDTRMALCRDIASALEFIHTNNIIHGDMNPRNVLVFGDKSTGYLPKLIDFGYSTKYSSPHESRVTMPQTIPWDAPEYRARLSDYSVDHAKKMDVYSYGMLVLWTIFRESLQQMGKRIQEEGSAGVVAQVSKGYRLIKSAVSSLIGIEYDPEPCDFKEADLAALATLRRECRRFKEPTAFKYAERNLRDMPDLPTSIRNCLERLFPCALTPNTDERISDFGSIRQLFPSNDQPGRDTPGATEVSMAHPTDPTTSNKQVGYQLAPELQKLCLADHRVRRALFLALKAQADDDDIPHPLRLNACFQVAICEELGFGTSQANDTSPYLEKSGKSGDDLDKALRSTREKVSYAPKIAKLYDTGIIKPADHALEFRPQENPAAIIEFRRGELEGLKKKLGKTHPAVINLSRTLQNLQSAVNDPSICGTLQSLATDLENDSNYGQDHFDTWITKADLAYAKAAQGKVDEILKAEEVFREVYEAMKRLNGHKHIATLMVAGNLSMYVEGRGHLKEAARLLEAVGSGFKSILGDSHAFTITSMQHVAMAKARTGAIDEASELLTASVRMMGETKGPNHPATFRCMMMAVEHFLTFGRYEDAADYNDRILKALLLEFKSPNHPALLQWNQISAGIKIDQQKYDEAAEMVKAMIDSYPDKSRRWPPPLSPALSPEPIPAKDLPQHPGLMYAYTQYTRARQRQAYAAAEQGNGDEASRLYQDARDILRPFLKDINERLAQESNESMPSLQHSAILQAYIQGHCYSIEMLVGIADSNALQGTHYTEARAVARKEGFEKIVPILDEHQNLCFGLPRPHPSGPHHEPTSFVNGCWRGTYFGARRLSPRKDIRNMRTMSLKASTNVNENGESVISGSAEDEQGEWVIQGAIPNASEVTLLFEVKEDEDEEKFEGFWEYRGHLHIEEKAIGGQWGPVVGDKEFFPLGTFIFYKMDS